MRRVAASTAGLVLTGGGARAAHQVGAIRALARIALGRTPFPILVGMSAGAVNSAALAVGSGYFREAATRLGRVWRALTPAQVYRTDGRRLASSEMRWIRDLTTSGLSGEKTINYRLETAPLRRLLERTLALVQLPAGLRSGAVRGLAVSETSYGTGTGATFLDGPRIRPWARSLRLGVRETIAERRWPRAPEARRVGERSVTGARRTGDDRARPDHAATRSSGRRPRSTTWR